MPRNSLNRVQKKINNNKKKYKINAHRKSHLVRQYSYTLQPSH